jgi:hypothetical protein
MVPLREERETPVQETELTFENGSAARGHDR